MTTAPSIRLDIIVLDTADPARDSTFWAELLGGERHTADPDWHEVTWGGPTIALQRAPGHVPPDWPDGEPMQVHLDFVVDDVTAAHEHALAVGARHLAREPSPSAASGFVVYADPSGHPFCLCWGQ